MPSSFIHKCLAEYWTFTGTLRC